MSQEVVSYYEDFNEIEKKIWDLLTNAVSDRSSEFRTPVFICGNDKDLDGRVVVLRKADQQNKFDHGFAVDWMRKDLQIAMDEAKKNNSPLPITKIIDEYYAEIQKMGGQRWDTSSLIKRFRK